MPVLGSHRVQVSRELGLYRGRQHRDPILVALAGTHHELVGAEVDVLHTQPAGFQDREPSSIHEIRHQADGVVEPRQQGSHLVTSEDDRQSLRPARPHDTVDPRHLLPEHGPVQEQQGAWF